MGNHVVGSIQFSAMPDYDEKYRYKFFSNNVELLSAAKAREMSDKYADPRNDPKVVEFVKLVLGRIESAAVQGKYEVEILGRVDVSVQKHALDVLRSMGYEWEYKTSLMAGGEVFLIKW